MDDNSPSDDETETQYREDCLSGSLVAQDLYPREEIHGRIREHVAESDDAVLDARGIDPEELEIRWCSFEDGVIAYKVTHPDMPPVVHEYLPQKGPNTEEVEMKPIPDEQSEA